MAFVAAEYKDVIDQAFNYAEKRSNSNFADNKKCQQNAAWNASLNSHTFNQ